MVREKKKHVPLKFSFFSWPTAARHTPHTGLDGWLGNALSSCLYWHNYVKRCLEVEVGGREEQQQIRAVRATWWRVVNAATKAKRRRKRTPNVRGLSVRSLSKRGNGRLGDALWSVTVRGVMASFVGLVRSGFTVAGCLLGMVLE